MAPVLLGQDDANANLLLLYLASMAAGLGLVAARRRWRLAMLVVAASYFGVAVAGARETAEPWGLLLYGVIGGAAGLYVGLSERWGETRFLAFTGGWALLAAASERMEAALAGVRRRAGAVGAGLVARASAVRGCCRSARAPARPGAGRWARRSTSSPPRSCSAGRPTASRPTGSTACPACCPLLVAVPYLLAGYLRPRPPFALVGAAAAAIAAQAQWSGTAETWALLGLALLWAALDHGLDRTDGRWYACLTWAAALNQLMNDALQARTAADSAFTGAWAVALWGATGAAVVLAAGLLRARPDEGEARLARSGLWIVAGLLMLFGVTAEIRRYFDLESISRVRAELASGLAVSAWWLIFAAALVLVGFRRSLKQLRLAGLAVAGLAVAKVVIYDLSSLDALYRVGSVFLLGLVMLSLAYLYYRNDRSEGTP